MVAVVTLSFLKAYVSDDGTEDNGMEGVVVERAFTVRPGMEEQSKIGSERQSDEQKKPSHSNFHSSGHL